MPTLLGALVVVLGFALRVNPLLDRSLGREVAAAAPNDTGDVA